MRRHLAVAFLVLAAAIPAFAQRRRAVSPGTPSRCAITTAPLAVDVLPDAMAIDDQYVYWSDTFAGVISRAPLSGGATQHLADISGDLLVLSMVVDDANIYLGVLPLAVVFGSPGSGEILQLAKTGGTPTTFMAGVNAPWSVAVDATHVYWVDAGTIDFADETIAPNGKVERAKKDGNERVALAENLSAPLDLALDADTVYYGETGLADGDPTMGAFRVAKSGGSVTTLTAAAAAAEIELTNDAVIFWGGNEQFDNALFRVNKNGSGFRLLLNDDALSAGPRVIDGRAYYMRSTEEVDEIRSIDVNNPGDSTLIVATVVSSNDFEVDACGLTYGDADGELFRVRR